MMPAFLDITIPLYNFLIMFTVGTGLTHTDFRPIVRTLSKVVVDRRQGGKWEDTQQALDYWAKRFRKRLDEVRQ